MAASTDYIQMISNIFLYSIMVIGVVGNLMVIIVILRTKDMRNSTNIFLLNLAVADLMVLLVWGNSSALVYVNSGLEIQNFREEMKCKAVSIFELTVFDTSVLTILAIGFERYYGICKPLKALYICTKTRAYTICVLAWVLAALSTSPSFFISHYTYEVHLDGTYYKPACLCWLDSFFRKAYILAGGLAFFFLPLITLTVVFIKISGQLEGDMTPSLNDTATRERRNAIGMLATVIVVFFVCHLPRRIIHLLVILPLELQAILGLDGIVNLNFYSAILNFLHSAMNPILYNLMSERFRAGFRNTCLDLANGCGIRKTASHLCGQDDQGDYYRVRLRA